MPGWPPRGPEGMSTRTPPPYIHSSRAQHVPVTDNAIEQAEIRANRLLHCHVKGVSGRKTLSETYEATPQGLKVKNNLIQLQRTLVVDEIRTNHGKDAYLSMLEDRSPTDPTLRFLVPADRAVLARMKDTQALAYAVWLLSHTPELPTAFDRGRVVAAVANMMGIDVTTLDQKLP